MCMVLRLDPFQLCQLSMYCIPHTLFCRVVMTSVEWFLYTIYIGLYLAVELLLDYTSAVLQCP